MVEHIKNVQIGVVNSTQGAVPVYWKGQILSPARPVVYQGRYMVQATPTTIGGGETGRVQLHEGQDPFTPPRAELNLHQARATRQETAQAQVHATPAPQDRAQTAPLARAEVRNTEEGREISPEGPGTRNDAAAAATMSNPAEAAISNASAGTAADNASAGAEVIPGGGGKSPQCPPPGTDKPSHQDETNQDEPEEMEFPPLHLSGPKKTTKKRTPKGKRNQKK